MCERVCKSADGIGASDECVSVCARVQMGSVPVYKQFVGEEHAGETVELSPHQRRVRACERVRVSAQVLVHTTRVRECMCEHEQYASVRARMRA
jgi:hypothetical protein